MLEGRFRVLAGLLIAACLSACDPGPPLRIGFVGSISGRWSDTGIGGRNGAQLAVEDLMDAGGVDGRSVDLVVEDDQQEPERAAMAVRELASHRVAFIVGPMLSLSAEAMSPELERYDVVAISPTAAGTALSRRDDHFFRVVSDSASGGRQQADDLWRRGVRRAATLADERNGGFAFGWADAFAARFTELGGSMLTELRFDSSAGPMYGRLARQVLAGEPDAVLLVASAVDTALISQQLRSVGHPIMIASSPWGATEQLIELGGAAVEGAIVGQYFNREDTSPRFRRFVERYTQRFGEAPGFPAVKAYDAVTAGVAAWRQRARGQSLRDALRNLGDVEGLQQPIRFDGNGDSDAPLFIAAVVGSRFGLERP